jgi:hypothetical protein
MSRNPNLTGGLFDGRGKPQPLKLSAKAARNITPEKHIQAAFISWRDTFKRQYPILNAIFACPNSIWAKNKSVAQSMVNQGMTRGITDIICLAPSHDKKYFGLLIEFKSETGKQTPEQIYFQDFFNELGYKSVVCRSAFEASTLVNEHLGIKVPIYPR